MNTPLKCGVAAIAILSTAAPAYAQNYPRQYDRDYQTYRDQQADYQARRASYESARREYEVRRDQYERARAAYDARWGYGAYARAYGPAPVWDDDAYAYAPAAAGYYGRDAAYNAPVNYDCRRTEDRNATTGAVLGAIAGAVLGSNVAARNARTEGAVLGAIVGGGVGLGIGKASVRCDDRGYYYSYNDTVAYSDAGYRYSSRYDNRYFTRMRCRLAPAPVDFNRDGREDEFRYVRVCPDANGRYRFVDDSGRFRYWG
ncbi:MAG: glycine zipper 2TM domain-containing protein [Phenylobacterium sp.]